MVSSKLGLNYRLLKITVLLEQRANTRDVCFLIFLVSNLTLTSFSDAKF